MVHDCKRLATPLTLADLAHEPRLWDVALALAGVANPQMRRFMVKKKYPYVIRKDHKDSSCPFLLNSSCMIYGSRPKVCRRRL